MTPNSGFAGPSPLEPLSEPDIVCYLPARSIFPDMTWGEVKERWRAAYPKNQAHDLKGFIENRFSVKATLKTIERALADCTAPPEIEQLGFRLNELAGFRTVLDDERDDPLSESQ